MSLGQAVFLLFASALAGAVNAVAGGGTLLSFPAALSVGLPPVVASATNSIAQAPGAFAAAWAYRRELDGKGRTVAWLAVPAVLGGLLGASLLLTLEESAFTAIVPWMVLLATALIVTKDLIWTKALAAKERPSRRRTVLLGMALLGIAAYSGYFGAGKNILVLGVLTLLSKMSIHEVNALKCAMVAITTSVSAVYFLAQGAADTMAALVMGLGAVSGSYAAASLARRVRPTWIRYAVVGIGLCLTGVLAYQRLA